MENKPEWLEKIEEYLEGAEDADPDSVDERYALRKALVLSVMACARQQERIANANERIATALEKLVGRLGEGDG